MKRYGLRKTSGMGTIVILVIVIAMFILGGSLIYLAVGGSTANDVAGTSLEGAATVTETGLTIATTLMPVMVWLLVAGVLIVALVFVYKGFKGRRKR